MLFRELIFVCGDDYVKGQRFLMSGQMVRVNITELRMIKIII